jgi:hypothetical protein
MGHHLTDDGQFKSDRHPDLPAGKIVLSFKDPHAQLGLWVTAIDYRAHDPELSADIMEALTRVGSVPPRAMFEDAWAWSIARQHGVDPSDTVRAFVTPRIGDSQALHIIGSQVALNLVEGIAEEFYDDVHVHVIAAGTEAPPRSATDDGRPDFHGFLLALRAEYHWSASLHSEDKTGQAAADQRALEELAQHVKSVGHRLGFLPVLKAAAAVSACATPSPAELVGWLREAAAEAADERRWRLEGANPTVRADNAHRLWVAAKLLWERNGERDPIGSWLSAASTRVANKMRLPADVTDAVAVAQLCAAADAIERLTPADVGPKDEP